MSNQLDLRKTYRAILDAARARHFISYGNLVKASDCDWNKHRHELNRHLGSLVKIAAERSWPMLTAIVVNQNNIKTGTLDGSSRAGFIGAANEFGFDVSDPVEFVEEQQQAIFAWAKNAPDELNDEEEAVADTEEIEFKPYGIGEILNDGCFLSEEALNSALSRLSAKKNLILQGPPGTGKTWLAKRLGYALIGTKNRTITRKCMRVIQFHPSLSYEDFVRGWRPDGNGQLSLIDGVFLEVVEAARAERDRLFIVIIEEINRGNPAQIFGEMLTLLENDKRKEDEAIELSYRRDRTERIYIPENLYVIGTMNIADRSLALVDLALRRRFAFVSLEPTFNKSWQKWCTTQADMDSATLAEIKRRMTELNEKITTDRSLGAQFKIGHSYVTPVRGERIADTRAWFTEIVETEIAPLLEEYWFDNLNEAVDSKARLLHGI